MDLVAIRITRGSSTLGQEARAPDVPPDSLVAPDSKAIADHSDLISEVPKILQNPNFLGLRPGPSWGELTALP